MATMRIVRLASLGLVVTLVAGCSALGIGGGTPAARPNRGARPGQTVSIAKVTTGPITQSVVYTGNVQSGDTVNVAPQTSGRIVKLNVNVGSLVKSGDVIAEIDPTTLQAQVAQAQAGVDAAQVKVDVVKAGARSDAVAAAQANAASATSKLDAVAAGARPASVALAQANVEQAKANADQAKAKLTSAQAALSALKAGPTHDQVVADQLKIEQAKDAAYAADVNKDGACGHQGYTCNAGQSTAAAAHTAVGVAQQDLKLLQDPSTQQTIAQAQATIDQAKATVSQTESAVAAAQQQLKLAAAPYTSEDIAQAQAAANAAADQAKLAASPYTSLDLKTAQVGVEQAKATLQIAQSQLAQATILAPFDGVVSAKLLSAGALASPATPIVTLISNNLQVQFSIEEARINNIKVGQVVSLTSNTYPGKLFPAKVTSIYPSADPKTHTFIVVVTPDNATGELHAGMFVTLQVVIAHESNATLVPGIAIVQQGTEQVVFTVANNQAHQQPVTTGIADGANIEVLKGLTPGESVVVAGQDSLADKAPVRIAGVGGSSPNRGGGARPAGTASPRSTGTPVSGAKPAGAQPVATGTKSAS